jgi:hypothetical protein
LPKQPSELELVHRPRVGRRHFTQPFHHRTPP